MGASALKRGIEELVNDPAVQEQIARETGDPEILAEYHNRLAESLTREFARQNPDYFRSQENWEAIVQILATNALGWAEDEGSASDAQEELISQGFWTLENLNAAYKALSRAGALEVRPGQPRTLTEHQLRAVALQASAGDAEGAATRYLTLRLPEDIGEMSQYAPSLQEALDEIADPEFKTIVAEAVWFAWENGRENYSPTTERRVFPPTVCRGQDSNPEVAG